MRKIIAVDHLLLALVIILTVFSSCKKQVGKVDVQNVTESSSIVSARNVYVNGTGVCDYPFNEAAVLAAGYTKQFEDNLIPISVNGTYGPEAHSITNYNITRLVICSCRTVILSLLQKTNR